MIDELISNTIVFEIKYKIINKKTGEVACMANSIDEAKNILLVKGLNIKDYDIVEANSKMHEGKPNKTS